MIINLVAKYVLDKSVWHNPQIIHEHGALCLAHFPPQEKSFCKANKRFNVRRKCSGSFAGEIKHKSVVSNELIELK